MIQSEPSSSTLPLTTKISRDNHHQTVLRYHHTTPRWRNCYPRNLCPSLLGRFVDSIAMSSNTSAARSQKTPMLILPTSASNARYPVFPSPTAPGSGLPCASNLTNSTYFLEPASGRPVRNITSVTLDGLMGGYNQPDNTPSLACECISCANDACRPWLPYPNLLLTPGWVTTTTRINHRDRNRMTCPAILAAYGAGSGQQPLIPFGFPPVSGSQYRFSAPPRPQFDPNYESRARDRYGDLGPVVSLPRMGNLYRTQIPIPYSPSEQELEDLMRAHQLMKIKKFVESRQHHFARPNTPAGHSRTVRQRKFWILVAVLSSLCFIAGCTTWRVLGS